MDLFKRRHYLEEMLMLNSFSFEDKDPSIYKAKTRSCTKVKDYSI